MAAGTASVACGCVSLFPLIATGVGLMGLAGVVGGSLQYAVLYLSAGLVLLGHAIALIRRRLPGPLLMSVGGAMLVLLPFHTALDVAIFSGSLYAGFALLLGASLWSLFPRPSQSTA